MDRDNIGISQEAAARMARLLTLSQSQWFLPVLAKLHETPLAGRAPMLRHRLGLSHSMARRTLDAMVAEGWLAPNPGQGHPLRPDFVLTDKGAALAPHAAAIIAERRARSLPLTGIGKWHLPLLAALGDAPARFSELEARMNPVTPRALSVQIKRSIDAGTVSRLVQPAFPPISLYRVNDEATTLRDRALAIAGA